jgi:Zn-dependent protease
MVLQLLFQQPELFFVWIIAIIFSLTIHEFCHALAGNLLGDRTAKMEGRLTLNPLSHIDFIGMIALILAGFGWGKPVPFNPYNLKYKKFGPALVAIGGPLSNLLAAVIFVVIMRIFLVNEVLSPDNLLMVFFEVLAWINLMLFIFNLIPLPPLDGSKILFSFLPYSAEPAIMKLERFGPMILLVIILFGGKYLAYLLDLVYFFVYRLFG